MVQKTAPNQYDLQGTGIRIGYSLSSIAGPPQLTFKKGSRSLNFTADEIAVVDTQIGTLVTVTIAQTPDRGFTTFSFLLPVIQLGTSGKQAFRTVGVTTVHKTTIAGPPKGVLETYKTTELRGTARAVEFLAQKSAKA